ncbi:MAG TPA: NAD(P)H-binding protein, partial [Balneolaceae bacterium]|nr:NAD(P)H-binding protein [Balneolaceae bacterium]
ADQILKERDLDYTILRPGRLFNKAGTGKITITDPAAQEGVPREDVADTVLEVLRQDNAAGKTIEFNEGNTPIEEVISKI